MQKTVHTICMADLPSPPLDAQQMTNSLLDACVDEPDAPVGVVSVQSFQPNLYMEALTVNLNI